MRDIKDFNIDPEGFKIINHIINKSIQMPFDCNTNAFFNRDDLFEEGIIGLFKAMENFDESKNIKFQTYAFRAIENQILMYIRDKINKNNKHFAFSLNENIKNDHNNELNLDYISMIGHNDKYFTYDEKFFDGLYKLVQQQFSQKIYHKVFYTMFLKYPRILKQREVQDELNISRSYVSRIITRMRNKMKHSRVFINYLNNYNIYDDYYE